jgi:hypothetical protein
LISWFDQTSVRAARGEEAWQMAMAVAPARRGLGISSAERHAP